MELSIKSVALIVLMVMFIVFYFTGFSGWFDTIISGFVGQISFPTP